jgi:general transcription factor 3C polypeptide 3 (transcription factor C subunit 4)
MANRLRNRVKSEEGIDVDANELDEEERRMLEQEENNMRMVAASHFRDIPFDKWLHVFIKV